MNAAHNGGPAFPTANGGSPDDGMTLRDYFAGLAMQGDIAGTPADEDPSLSAHHVARRAYAIADAMLRERAK